MSVENEIYLSPWGVYLRPQRRNDPAVLEEAAAGTPLLHHRRGHHNRQSVLVVLTEPLYSDLFSYNNIALLSYAGTSVPMRAGYRERGPLVRKEKTHGGPGKPTMNKWCR